MIKKIIKAVYPNAGYHFSLIQCFVKHKSFKPEKIKLKNDLVLFADWHEPRGKTLILGDAKGQPNIKAFWNTTIQGFKPEVVLDIGLNYVEVLFNTTYPMETQLAAIQRTNKYSLLPRPS